MSFYKQDPNNSKKQIPNRIGGGIQRYSHATCPPARQITKRPSYVTVNSTGSYAFLYETTASAGGTTFEEGYMTGSSIQNANAGGIKLDINPVAWKQTDESSGEPNAVGDVTFIYVRVS